MGRKRCWEKDAESSESGAGENPSTRDASQEVAGDLPVGGRQSKSALWSIVYREPRLKVGVKLVRDKEPGR
jgi:hypothetical protein